MFGNRHTGSGSAPLIRLQSASETGELVAPIALVAPTARPLTRRQSMLDQSSNLLLNSLSPKSRAFLQSRLRPVTLAAREVLYEPDESPKFAHFMTGGIASVVGTMSSALLYPD
jgi:hypothetical protein